MKSLNLANLGALLLLASRAWATDYPTTCLAADYVICEGPPAFMGSQGVTTIRIGANNNNGSPSGRAAVMIFPLPVLGAGESSATATLTVNVAGRSGSPAFNADLWGIGFQGNTTAIVEYFEANTGDSGNTKLQDNVITPGFTNGDVTLTNHAGLGAYLQTFYAANPGYAGGSYIFLRMNPDADSGTTSLGWSISANESGVPAVLTITTTGGPTNLPPQITTPPQSQSVPAGSNVVFNVTATGSGTLGYQWYFSNTALTNGGRISGATSSALNLTATITNDAGDYFVIVTNAFGSATSSVAALTVLVPVTVNTTNFIVIITDDHRWDSLGVVQREMGATGRFPWFTNGTPNLDRLAAGGVRFRNAFVTLSLCSPSRAAVMTGRYNHFNGVINNSTAFPTASVTWATQLRAAGYVTGMVGKWHHGQQAARPGFDYYASYLGQGTYDNATFQVNGVATPTTGWVDDVATDYAISFITTNRTNSFGLFLGYKSSHSPHTPPAWAANLYSNSVSLAVPNLSVPPPYRTNIAVNSETAKRNYHRCLTGMDVGVGRILDQLDQLGLTTNTMVVFMGDNGFYLGEHGLGDKRSLYEESLRVPMIVRYPRVLTQPAVRDELVLNIDIAPTFLDLAGVTVPPEMQGRSWRPLLAGGSVTNWRQSFLAEYILEDGFAIPTTAVLRTTDSKLVFWPGEPEWCEMFNLTNDRYEVTNLFNLPAHQAMRASLRAEFDRQLRETGLGAELTNLKLSNGLYSLTLTGGLGPNYQLETSSNLQTWTPLSQIKMTSTQASVTASNAAAPRNYYRTRWIGD